jgi:hypothetical protein
MRLKFSGKTPINHGTIGLGFYVSGNPDWLDMAFMSRCDLHICANSTFSWWGAFLRVSHRELSATPVDVVREDQELRRWGDSCDHLDRS